MMCRVLILLGIAAVAVAAEALPGATAADWLADPADAARKAGAVADRLNDLGAGFWAGVTGAALTGLAVLKWATPIIARVVPVWGPLVEGAANLAWNLAATPKQKQADRELELTKQAAGYLGPALASLRSLPPGSLPERVQETLNMPIVQAAIDHLNNPNERA